MLMLCTIPDNANVEPVYEEVQLRRPNCVALQDVKTSLQMNVGYGTHVLTDASVSDISVHSNVCYDSVVKKRNK